MFRSMILMIPLLPLLTSCAGIGALQYLHADAQTPTEQLAIIRIATKEERQLGFSFNPLKTIYTPNLLSVRDPDGATTQDLPAGLGIGAAHVAPGTYIVRTSCSFYSSISGSVSLEQLLSVEAGKVYALECSQDPPRSVHILVDVHPQQSSNQ